MPILQPLIPRAAQALLGSIGAPNNELGGPLTRTNELGDSLPPLDTLPDAPAPVDPLVARTNALNADIERRTAPKPPATTTLGKIGHVAAGIGNVLGDIFAPETMALIPGTQLHNERILARDKADLEQTSQEQTAQSGRAQQAATTAYTEQRPAIEQAKIQQKQLIAQNKIADALRVAGKTPVFDEDGNLTDAPDDPTSQSFKDRVALAGMHNATAAFDQIKGENADQKYQPGTPQYQEWKQRLDNAQKTIELHTSALGLSAERLGFQQDKFYNPQPTGTQRTKGDMGNSAVDQIHTMRSLVAAHPEFAGPGAGATQAFQRWLSSNGEDAGKFLAARQYLADHSAAVFGGRGEYISKQMEGLTNPNFSPSTLGGVLDQAEETANKFVKAGQTHNKAGVLQPAQSAAPTPKVRTFNSATGRLE